MAAGIVVGIAVVLVAVVSYFVVRSELVGQVDNALRAQANLIEARAGVGRPFPTPPASVGGPAPYAWIVSAGGSVYQHLGDIRLRPSPRMRAVAGGESSAYMPELHIGSSHLRALVFQIPAAVAGQPVAVVLARPLNSIDHVLRNLRVILLGLIIGGIALAAALGRLAARRVLAPLSDVADTVQHISETEDLTSRIHVRTYDEVGQLAMRFNAMLERLEASRAELDESVGAQRQLVADASHELRTPVTSLRTNIELLLEHPHLTEDERRRMLADVVEQTEELTGLVGDLIELARGELPPESAEEVRLDQVVDESLLRAERNFPEITFDARLSPMVVTGAPERLGRAVNNLLDNAAVHSVPGSVVEVGVSLDGVRVRDHGPGVAEADLPHIFDRFYRGASSRGTQGSGLGLAIVRQVAEQHGGSVEVANAPDGGAVFTLHLPLMPADASGSGWPGDASLPGGLESPAQEDEQDGEHRDNGEQQRPTVQRTAE
jgi:two-component system sensor histidine kinase MprB